jgi:signal transduction histidine kinase
MKLKNRFLSIIFGTILIPLFVTILVMLLIAPEFVTFGENVHRGVREFFKSLEDGVTLQELTDVSESFSEKFSLTVLDDDNRIILRKDSSFDDNLFTSELTQQLIMSRRLTFDDGKTYTVVIGSSLALQYNAYVNLLIIGSVLVFLILISFHTIRSINRSIVNLEESTRRIADGDLDTPVKLYGDDTFISLAESINTMRLKVKEEYDRRTRFFTGVSHDLKTPLASITGYSQALLDGLADDDQTRDKYLSIIYRKGKVLERRIVQLIEYIKLTNNDYQSNLHHRMLVPFLEDFVALQKDEASLFGYTFEAEILIDRDTIIPFDQDLFLRAIENLMQNSYRYGDTTRPIRLLCQYKDDTIRLSFVNHHLEPISQESIKHLFEPFYRGDQSRKGEGFGLGLASVKSIAESHGWTVEVQSIERTGITVFQIVIPRSQQQQLSIPEAGSATPGPVSVL